MLPCKTIAALALIVYLPSTALAGTPLQDEEIPVLTASTRTQSTHLTIFSDGICFVRDRRHATPWTMSSRLQPPSLPRWKTVPKTAWVCTIGDLWDLEENYAVRTI